MKHLDRISGLLSKAERSGNPHEAEAYLAKAQALATQSSVDLAVARARIAKREAREQPVRVTITIGESGKRANTHLVTLFITIAKCNSLQIDVARNSTFVIAYGMLSDIELAQTLYGSIATQMIESANSWLALGQWRSDYYLSRDGCRKPHTAQTARAAFYRAFTARIGKRLESAREKILALAERQHVDLPNTDDFRQGEATTGALVLRGKEAQVKSFHQQASNARGSWLGYTGAVTHQAGQASLAGSKAASRARLSSSRGLPGKGPGIPG